MDTGPVDRFVAAVRAIDGDQRPGASTSVRRRPAVAEALALAVDLGLAGSANGLSESALVDELRRLAHGAAIETHYRLYPEDRPSRAEVATVALRRTGDPLADRRDLLDRAEALLRRDAADREPTVSEVVAAARGLGAGLGAA